MDTKEIIINKIIVAMQEVIDTDQLRKLDDILRINLVGIKLEEECTELSTETDDNMYILKVFAANKKLEGCKDKTIEQYVRHARNFLNDVDKNYKHVDKNDVKKYLAVYSTTVSHNTVANAKRYLSSFYTWLHDEGYVELNPVKTIKGIRQQEVENKYLSVEEEVAVRDVPKSIRDRALIDFMLSTGLRVGELEALNRSNVDFSNNSVTFVGEKNGKQRTVYLDAAAKKHLMEYLFTRTDQEEALFTTEKRYKTSYGTYDVKRICKHALERITKTICRQAGITNRVCTVHVMRKTFATRLAENGCPLEIIQELLGHSSAAITSKHYVKKTPYRVKMEFQRCMGLVA